MSNARRVPGKAKKLGGTPVISLTEQITAIAGAIGAAFLVIQFGHFSSRSSGRFAVRMGAAFGGLAVIVIWQVIAKKMSRRT